MSKWYDPLKSGARQGAFIFTHFLIALLFVASGFGLHHMLELMGDPKLYDVLPWRYVVDTMDVTIIVTFVVMGVLEAVRIFRHADEG